MIFSLPYKISFKISFIIKNINLIYRNVIASLL